MCGGSKASVVVNAAGNTLGGLLAGGSDSSLTIPHRPPRLQIEASLLSCLGVGFHRGKILLSCKVMHEADTVS